MRDCKVEAGSFSQGIDGMATLRPYSLVGPYPFIARLPTSLCCCSFLHDRLALKIKTLASANQIHSKVVNHLIYDRRSIWNIFESNKQQSGLVEASDGAGV